MNVNLNTVLVNIDGKPLKKLDKDLTLKIIITDALLQMNPDERNLSADEKLKRYELALKIRKNDAISLESDDTVLIKMLINKVYGTLVIGQTHSLLEGKTTGLEDVAEHYQRKLQLQQNDKDEIPPMPPVKPPKADDESIPDPDVEVLEPSELTEGCEVPKKD